jgi:hypothetical protein
MFVPINVTDVKQNERRFFKVFYMFCDYPGQRDILPDRRQDHINIIIILTVYNRTVFKNGSCCTVRLGNVSCLQKFQHFWMIIRDLFFIILRVSFCSDSWYCNMLTYYLGNILAYYLDN